MSSSSSTSFPETGSIIELVPHHNESLRADFGRCGTIQEDFSKEQDAEKRENYRKIVFWQKSASEAENLHQKFRLVVVSNNIVSIQSIALRQQQQEEHDQEEFFLMCVGKTEGSQCFLASKKNVSTNNDVACQFRLIPTSSSSSLFTIEPIFASSMDKLFTPENNNNGAAAATSSSLILEANKGRGMGAELVLAHKSKSTNEDQQQQQFRLEILYQPSKHFLQTHQQVFEASKVVNSDSDKNEKKHEDEKATTEAPIEDGDIVEFIPQHNPSLRIAVKNGTNGGNNTNHTLHLWHASHQEQDERIASQQRWKVHLRTSTEKQDVFCFSPLAFPKMAMTVTPANSSSFVSLSQNEDLNVNQSFCCVVSRRGNGDGGKNVCFVSTAASSSAVLTANKGRGLGAELVMMEKGEENEECQTFEVKIIAKIKSETPVQVSSTSSQQQQKQNSTTLMKGEVITGPPCGYTG